MKISKIVVDMGNGELKEFEPIDVVILAICQSNTEGQNIILEQLGSNPSLQLKMLKDIVHLQEEQPQHNIEEEIEHSGNTKEDELPIEVIDEE